MVAIDIRVVQSCIVSHQLDEVEECANNVGECPQWDAVGSWSFNIVHFQTLDEVNITVETCESARTDTGTAGLQSLTASQGKYSFIHKVVDGITIIVNTVNVKFKSPVFTASVQVSRIAFEITDRSLNA